MEMGKQRGKRGTERSRREVAAGSKGTSSQMSPRHQQLETPCTSEGGAGLRDWEAKPSLRVLTWAPLLCRWILSLIVCGRQGDIHREIELMGLHTLSLKTAKKTAGDLQWEAEAIDDSYMEKLKGLGYGHVKIHVQEFSSKKKSHPQ